MKKVAMKVVALAVLFSFSASFVLADDTTIKIGIGLKQDQDQWQQQEQLQKQKQTIKDSGNSKSISEVNFEDNSRSIGALPQAFSHGVQLPIAMPSSGHLAVQSSISAFMGECEPFNAANFQIIVDAMERSGSENWAAVSGRIISHPFIKRQFSQFPNHAPVYFMEMKRLESFGLANIQIAGAFVYVSKHKKDKPVLPMYYNAQAYLDAMDYGANILIPYDQYLQMYAESRAGGVDLAAVVSTITRAFTTGGSGAGNAAFANGTNTQEGGTGAAFVFARIEGFSAEICGGQPAPPVVQLPQPKPCDPSALLLRIETLREGTLNCPDECLNNELLWKQIGDADMDLWYCTNDPRYLHEAMYAYGRSERNFLEGREPSGKRTRDLEGALAVLYRVHYNWALAVRELNGREAELSFAKSKELHLKGDRTMPAEQADMKR